MKPDTREWDWKEEFKKLVTRKQIENFISGVILDNLLYFFQEVVLMNLTPVIESMRLSTRKKTLEEAREALPKEVEVESPTYEQPTDPMIAADQAFNKAIQMSNRALTRLIEEK